MGDDHSSATLQHARSHVSYLLENSPVYGHFLGSVEVVSATSASVIVHLPLQRIHLNSKNGLHGAVSATLVDFIGGVAIACYDQRDNTGVSVDIHVSYLGAAKEGEIVEVEGRADKVGGTLAYTSVTIRKVQQEKGQGEGDLVATGTHTKFVKQR